MTAARFSFKLGMFAGSKIAATSFAQFLNKMRTAQMQSVFPEFLSQFINGIVKLFYLFP